MSELEATGGETLLAPEPATTSTWYGEDFAEVVEKKGWKEPTDVLRSYTELEKNASGKVRMPDFSNPEQNAEEIRAFYQKTGCPENPDGYETRLPEGGDKILDQETMSIIKKAAWGAGTSQQALDTTLNTVVGEILERQQKAIDVGMDGLKQELGDKFDEEVHIAQRFTDSACSEEFKNFLNESGWGDHPTVIKEFINLGKKTMSDTLVRGDSTNPDDKAYVPKFKDSPGMYATGEDEESKKARAYFEERGHKY